MKAEGKWRRKSGGCFGLGSLIAREREKEREF